MSINYYRHHLGDYAKNTQSLSMTEHGAYRLLLDYYYSTERALPNDLKVIHRICRAITPAERRAVSKILSKYFLPKDGVWYHSRVEEEIKKYNEISEERKKAGAIAHAKRMQTTPLASSQKPVANSHSKLASKNGFQEELWEEEVLPSRWQDIAEEKGVPNEQIFTSWKRFKEKTGFPLRLSRWAAWVANERVN